MPFEEIAGIRVNVESCGTGSPALIFVHGGACDRHDWDAQSEQLSRRFRIVTADMPGHGESAPATTASVEAVGQVVSGLGARYGNGRSILIGHSMGCRFILDAYQRAPSDVVGLIFIEGSYFPDERTVPATRDQIRQMGVQAFLERLFGQMLLPGSDPALRQKVMSRSERWNVEFLLSMIRWDAREAARILASVTVPVLLLQSTSLDEKLHRRSLQEGMTTPWMELVASAVPRAQLRVLPGVGHFPQIEVAEPVNRLICEFAEQCGPK